PSAPTTRKKMPTRRRVGRLRFRCRFCPAILADDIGTFIIGTDGRIGQEKYAENIRLFANPAVSAAFQPWGGLRSSLRGALLSPDVPTSPGLLGCRGRKSRFNFWKGPDSPGYRD